MVVPQRQLEEDFLVTATVHDIYSRSLPFFNDPEHPTQFFTMEIKAWTMGEHGLVGELQNSPVKSDEPTETIDLIPMGAARLRISAFPLIGEGSDAISWK